MKTILLILCILSCTLLMSQEVAKTLEKSLRIEKGNSIIFKYENGILKYAQVKNLSDGATFYTYNDSFILVSEKSINVYFVPLNPLNFSLEYNITTIIDPIDTEADKAFETILNSLSLLNPKGNSNDAKLNYNLQNSVFELQNINKNDPCPQISLIKELIEKIADSLKDSKKNEVLKQFEALKKLDFANKLNTKEGLDGINEKIQKIKKHFDDIEPLLTQVKNEINSYSCKTPEPFTTKYILANMLKDLESIKSQQYIRLKNLLTAFELANNTYKNSSTTPEGHNCWALKLDNNEVQIVNGKLSIFNLTISNNGFNKSNDNEIIKTDPQVVFSKAIKFKKFWTAYPEVSVGSVFTFFKYNTYGTTLDNNNKIVVAPPVENVARNINITTMVNYNFYTPTWKIHPLIQIGGGLNSGIPTILLGGGLRFGESSTNRIRITGGIAFTWIQELNKLNVGDQISGTSDIENDLVYRFTWPPKGYIGIQWNF